MTNLVKTIQNICPHEEDTYTISECEAKEIINIVVNTCIATVTKIAIAEEIGEGTIHTADVLEALQRKKEILC